MKFDELYTPVSPSLNLVIFWKYTSNKVLQIKTIKKKINKKRLTKKCTSLNYIVHEDIAVRKSDDVMLLCSFFKQVR